MIVVSASLEGSLRGSPRAMTLALGSAADRAGGRFGRRLARHARIAGGLDLGRLLSPGALAGTAIMSESDEPGGAATPDSDIAATAPANGAGRERARRSPTRRPAARTGAKKSSPSGPGPGGRPAPAGASNSIDMFSPARAFALAGFGARARRMRAGAGRTLLPASARVSQP